MIRMIMSHLSNKSDSARLANVSLFICLSFAAFTTVWSIYLDSFLHNASMVGLISGSLGVVSILGFLFFTPLIEKYPESKIWVMAALTLIMAYFMLYLVKSIYLVLIGAGIYVLARVLYTEVQGILICDSCKKKDLGKGVGFYGSFRNIGYVLGPLLAGFIAFKLGIPFVFLFCGVFVLLAFFMFETIKLKECNHHTKDEGTLKSSFHNLITYFKTWKLFKAYIVSGGVPFYWAIIYIFGPLYAIRNGLSGNEVGIFLFCVAIPMVLFSYSSGKMADKIGYRKLFIFGHLIMASFMFLAFISKDFYFTLLYIILGSIGASFIESPRESYFFTKVKKSEEEKYYGPYKTHGTVFDMSGQILGGIILIFLPLKYIFLFLSIVMVMFALASTKVRR